MTYQELCSFDTLWTAYHRARRCKRGKKSTAPFEYSAIEELLILSNKLVWKEKAERSFLLGFLVLMT